MLHVLVCPWVSSVIVWLVDVVAAVGVAAADSDDDHAAAAEKEVSVKDRYKWSIIIDNWYFNVIYVKHQYIWHRSKSSYDNSRSPQGH